MKRNIGYADILVRFGITVIVLLIANAKNSMNLTIIAFLPLISAYFKWSPVYWILRISTHQQTKKLAKQYSHH